jgi:hypothetical protein
VLAGKYRGANMKEAIQAMEGGVKELNTLLRGKGLVAPEEYDTSGEIFQKLGKEPTEALLELGKNLGMTQKQVEGVAPELVEMMEDIATDNQVRMLASDWELEPGSPEFNERKGKVERWVNEAIGEGRFSADEVFGESGWARTSGGIQALEILMSKKDEQGFWTGGSNAETKQPRHSSSTLRARTMTPSTRTMNGSRLKLTRLTGVSPAVRIRCCNGHSRRHSRVRGSCPRAGD